MPKSTSTGSPGRSQQDVAGGEVAVHHAVVVHEGQRGQQAAGQRQHLGRVQPAGRGLGALLGAQPIAHGAAGDVLHHQGAGRLVDVVDGHHARVAQPGHRPGLVEERPVAVDDARPPGAAPSAPAPGPAPDRGPGRPSPTTPRPSSRTISKRPTFTPAAESRVGGGQRRPGQAPRPPTPVSGRRRVQVGPGPVVVDVVGQQPLPALAGVGGAALVFVQRRQPQQGVPLGTAGRRASNGCSSSRAAPGSPRASSSSARRSRAAGSSGTASSRAGWLPGARARPGPRLVARHHSTSTRRPSSDSSHSPCSRSQRCPIR